MDSTDFNEMSWVSWMTPVDDEPTRESWLLSAIDRMARGGEILPGMRFANNGEAHGLRCTE